MKTNTLGIQPKTLFVSRKTWDKIQAYTRLCEYEIAGLGAIKQLDDGNFLLYDACILKQKVHSTTADFTDDAVITFLKEMKEEEKSVEHWVCWWHSHVNMDVFFSGTDIATTDQCESAYMVSVITNKRGDAIARLDVYEPVRATEGLSVEVLQEASTELDEACEAEIAEKVEKPAKTTYHYGKGYAGTTWNGRGQAGFLPGNTDTVDAELRDIDAQEERLIAWLEDDSMLAYLGDHLQPLDEVGTARMETLRDIEVKRNLNQEERKELAYLRRRRWANDETFRYLYPLISDEVAELDELFKKENFEEEKLEQGEADRLDYLYGVQLMYEDLHDTDSSLLDFNGK